MSDRRGRLTLLATVLGSGIAFLDGTVVNVALPTIGRKLHADVAGLQWVVSAYTLTLAALILLGGSLGDRYGRRKVYLLGITGLRRLLDPVRDRAEHPDPGRRSSPPGRGGGPAHAGQPGHPAGELPPRGPDARDRRLVRAHRRRDGRWARSSAAGWSRGPGGRSSGSTCRSPPSWSCCAAASIPESSDPEASHHLDTTGVLLAATGLAGTTYALTAWGSNGADAMTVTAAVVGVAALVGFVVAERRQAMPMVPLTLFSSRDFSVVNFVTLLVYAALSGCFLFLAIQLQVSGGYSPLAAGAATVPVSVLMLLLSERAGALASRIGARVMIGTGSLVCAARPGRAVDRSAAIPATSPRCCPASCSSASGSAPWSRR